MPRQRVDGGHRHPGYLPERKRSVVVLGVNIHISVNAHFIAWNFQPPAGFASCAVKRRE